MEIRHENAMRRIFQADKGLADDGREPEQFHLRHSGGMESHIEHPCWDSSWATPSEQTIDDLEEMKYLRVEPHDNKTRSFVLTVEGRAKGAEIAAPGTGTASAATGHPTADRASSGERSIFIVHGHSREDEVARAVQEITGRQPILLAEQPGRGQTIIEKFEAHAGTVGFAVVLLTADDVGAAKGDPGRLSPRARQNAILELGYFLAKVGRENVAVLYEAEVELPSDYTGVEYISFAAEWRWKLRRELKAAGFEAAGPTS